VRRGIAPDRITTAGRGEREPLVPTADEVAEPRNRRVEISVR
jgi:outer membrane protein OmpA-like peptidoglycan-associated protein